MSIEILKKYAKIMCPHALFLQARSHLSLVKLHRIASNGVRQMQLSKKIIIYVVDRT